MDNDFEQIPVDAQPPAGADPMEDADIDVNQVTEVEQ